ncbi:MAG: MATE family efflux transporter [Chloroflexia bacterium]|nr:MATE family efflux transporter [Chloroflexia bacterium]
MTTTTTDNAATGRPSAAGREIAAGAMVDAPPMTQRRVLGLSLPIIGENFLQSAVGIIDTLMIARVGSAALAGVGVSLEIVFFMIAILSSISIGGTVLISQAIGARNRERANTLARQTVLWGLMLSIPLGVLGYVSAPGLIGLFHTEPDVAEYATTYLQITVSMIVTLLMTFVCGAVLRGAGDSRSPLVASLVANAVKIVLSYGLIFGNFGLPRMEVAGSAISSGIARGAAVAIMLWILYFGARRVTIRGPGSWIPNFSYVGQLLRLGVPAAIEQMLLSAGFTVIISIVAVIGTPALAAQQISFNSLSLAIMPGFGFAIAATALVGQSIGANRPDHAREAARIANRWATIWLGAAAVVYIVFSEQIVRIYTDDQAVIDQGSAAMKAIGLGLPLWASWTVHAGALRGSGDTRSPLVFGTSAMWLAVLLSWVLVHFFIGQLWMVWLTFFVTTPIPAVMNRVTFRQRIRRAEQDLVQPVPALTA